MDNVAMTTTTISMTAACTAACRVNRNPNPNPTAACTAACRVNRNPNPNPNPTAACTATGKLKMQDWKMANQIAGVENAGLKNSGPFREVVLCFNCIASTVMQLL